MHRDRTGIFSRDLSRRKISRAAASPQRSCRTTTRSRSAGRFAGCTCRSGGRKRKLDSRHRGRSLRRGGGCSSRVADLRPVGRRRRCRPRTSSVLHSAGVRARLRRRRAHPRRSNTSARTSTIRPARSASCGMTPAWRFGGPSRRRCCPSATAETLVYPPWAIACLSTTRRRSPLRLSLQICNRTNKVVGRRRRQIAKTVHFARSRPGYDVCDWDTRKSSV